MVMHWNGLNISGIRIISLEDVCLPRAVPAQNQTGRKQKFSSVNWRYVHVISQNCAYTQNLQFKHWKVIGGMDGDRIDLDWCKHVSTFVKVIY